MLPSTLFVAESAAASMAGGMIPWVVALAGLALLPFILTMVTSFAKIVIVGGLIRQALGTQQVPPNTVITGLALILSVHVMWPVGTAMSRSISAALEHAPSAKAPVLGEGVLSKDDQARVGTALRGLEAAREPMANFLRANADPRNIALFEQLSRASAARTASVVGEEQAALPAPEDWRYDVVVLTPAFVLTELTEAFKIGFLIFVPFLVIDLVVSNILLALGMHMLSPQTVSLPLKLMLFVLIDGWSLIVKGLVLGYA